MEEVKLALKPYYKSRDVSKEEYKDILRKSVPKVRNILLSFLLYAFILSFK